MILVSFVIKVIDFLHQILLYMNLLLNKLPIITKKYKFKLKKMVDD